MPHFTRNFPDKTLVDRVLCKLDGSKPHFLQAEVVITPCEKIVCHKCFAEYISFIGEYVADRCSYECILCDRVHSYKKPFEIYENYFKRQDFDFKSIYAYVLQTLRSFQMEIKGTIRKAFLYSCFILSTVGSWQAFYILLLKEDRLYWSHI